MSPHRYSSGFIQRFWQRLHTDIGAHPPWLSPLWDFPFHLTMSVFAPDFVLWFFRLERLWVFYWNSGFSTWHWLHLFLRLKIMKIVNLSYVIFFQVLAPRICLLLSTLQNFQVIFSCILSRIYGCYLCEAKNFLGHIRGGTLWSLFWISSFPS